MRHIKKFNESNSGELPESTLADLEAGDEVYCGGDSGFCHPSNERIERVTYKFDEDSGERYKVIWLSGGRKFDSRDGSAMSPPLAYYIEIIK